MAAGLLCFLAMLPPAGPVPLGTPATGPAEKLLLRQWSSPGAYEMTVTSEAEQTVTVGKRVLPGQRTSQTMVLSLTVEKPDASGDRTIGIAYRRLQHRISEAGRVMAFDSDGPRQKQDPDLAAALGPLLKARVTVVLSGGGEVRSVRGLDELWDEMIRKDPASAALLEQMKQQMGNGMIRSLLEKDRKMLPSGPVGVGDVWEVGSIQSMPFVGAVDGTQQCTFKAIEKTAAGKLAVIEYQGRVKRTEKSVARFGARSVTVHQVDLLRTGEIRFDADAGMVTSKMFQQDGRIEMSGEDARGLVTQMVVRPRLEVRTRLRRLVGATQPEPEG
jgi:hypothetical protein